MLRRTGRLAALVALLLLGLLIELTVFPLAGLPTRRAAIRLWSRGLVAACGLRLEADPQLAELAPGRLIVANHLSWLDVFAIDAVAPSAFVAKAEIRRWPAIGTLVALAGTVYIERSRRHAVRAVIESMRLRMRQGWPAAVFPEATTTDGSRLLPFYANLIEAACEEGAQVLVVGLRYRSAAGAWPDEITFVGDTTFLANLWSVIGAVDLSVEVRLIEVLDPAGRTRHELARLARDTLSRRLALPLADS